MYARKDDKGAPIRYFEETSKKVPRSRYAQYKLRAEGVVEEAMQCSLHSGSSSRRDSATESRINAAILRFSHIYPDTGLHSKPSGYLPQLVHNAIRGLPLPVAGTNRRIDLLHVSDGVDAILRAISYLESNPGIGCEKRVFNIGRGKSTKMRDLVRAILNDTHSLSKILVLPNPSKFLLDDVNLNTERSRQLLGSSGLYLK